MDNEIWRVKTVTKKTGLSQSEVYRLAKMNEFPKPFRFDGGKSGWASSEVQSWIDGRIAAARVA